MITFPKKKAKANELDACPEKKLNLPPHVDLTNLIMSFNWESKHGLKRPTWTLKRLVNWSVNKIRIRPKITNEIIDTLVLARNKFPGSTVSLDALCKRFRIDNSKRIRHTALIDCALLAKVYINLIDQKEPTLDFNNHEDLNIDKNNLNLNYFKKIILPTESEKKNHDQYLRNNLKKNNFN